MESISIFIKVIDKLTSLLQGRVSDKRRLFTEIIEPIFQELQPVVDDYLRLFRESHKKIEKSSGNEWTEVVSQIKEHREELWHARTKIVAFADAIDENVKDKRVSLFANKVLRLFCATDEPKDRRMSRSRELIELLELLDKPELDKGFVMQRIKTTENQVKDSWVAIAQSYAQLRIEMMK